MEIMGRLLEYNIPCVVFCRNLDIEPDLIVAATNEAVRKMQAESEKKYSQVTGGISIPGLF